MLVVALVFVVGAPLAVSTLFFSSIRSAVARRLGGRAAEDEATLVELKLRMDALERQLEVVTQVLQRPGSPASFPPQRPPPPDRSLMR
jgi:hypothetical protein